MDKLLKKNLFTCFLLISIWLFLTGCMRYLTLDREEVILDGVDIDQTLKVAEVKMNERKGKIGTSLPVWVIRDQVISPDQGRKISSLYFQHVDSLQKKFDLWHLSWAVSNIYRLGNDSIKEVMHNAYSDASRRALRLKGITDRMVNGEKIYMGDAHSGGRAFARKHVVVPGNNKYLQSFEQFKP